MAEVASPVGGGDGTSPDARRRRERVQSWVRGRRERLEAARGTSTTVGFAFDALSYDTDTGAPVLAAALAFRVFLFEVPCMLVFVILAGFVRDVTGHDVTSSFHGQGIPHLTALSVSSAAELSGWGRLTGLAFAVYALFFSARSLVKVLNIVHALVWDVPRKTMRGANRAAVLFIGLITLLLGLSLGIGIVRGESSVGGVTLLILYTFVPFAAWWWVSRRLPHRDCPLIALAPGAALFALGLEVLHVATVVWFPHYIKSKSDLYGTIGISLVILLWAYLIGRVITLAAVLNAALWRRFGPEAAQPLQVRRPAWRVPFIDDKVNRIWVATFGGNEHGDGEQEGDERTETFPPPE